MIILFGIPLWLAVIIFAIHALAASGRSKKPTMIQRIITAPDGTVQSFIVPADEPADVTIARMAKPVVVVPAAPVLKPEPEPKPTEEQKRNAVAVWLKAYNPPIDISAPRRSPRARLGY